MPRLPYLLWYPNDWLAEPSLRACSLAARGLMIDVLSLCHLSPRRGYLLAANGSRFTTEQLARVTGCSAEECERLLAELEGAGAFSRAADGSIYSRRMVRDESKREKCGAAGRRGGGNPRLRRRPEPSSSPPPGETAEYVAAPDSEEPPPESSGPGLIRLAPWSEFQEAWKAVQLPGHETLQRTPHRVGLFQSRQHDPWWRENWKAAIVRAAASPRCRGEQGDWELRPDMLLKATDLARRILEGEFDARASSSGMSHGEKLVNEIAGMLGKVGAA